MGFTIDHSDVSESQIIKVGTYEAVIQSVMESVTRNGAENISFNMVIRNDIDQPYKNMHIWYSIWKKKEPSAKDLEVCGYNKAQINLVSAAAALPNSKQYRSLEEWLSDLERKPLLISVVHDEYPAGSGKVKAKVKTVEKTAHPALRHVFKEKQQQAGSKMPSVFSPEFYDDDSLPF